MKISEDPVVAFEQGRQRQAICLVTAMMGVAFDQGVPIGELKFHIEHMFTFLERLPSPAPKKYGESGF